MINKFAIGIVSMVFLTIIGTYFVVGDLRGLHIPIANYHLNERVIAKLDGRIGEVAQISCTPRAKAKGCSYLVRYSVPNGYIEYWMPESSLLRSNNGD